ncbi:acetyltransferase (GNAT) family protein [Natranaerovirga pectinivora]|uniref:Acetyltransferase (GNAT) family protein n=1 Tax=Natranaerovirga pectinivora TaxID=682400 RepID=A0A4R3MMV3_9FIRM|nr:GNAT family N-acetyltransferase [Natranaerovirga pectinivora]TCT15623.1 acetyltransferase (GNAT) family protein [Natranaerovirga pectinivora]
MESIKLTDRLKRVFSLAEEDVEDILYPIHILIGVLKEKTGILGELSLKIPVKIEDLKIVASNIDIGISEIKHDFFNSLISKELLEVIKRAEILMKKYGQIYLNEGHVIKAIFSLDNEVNRFFSKEVKDLVQDITTTARDLIVNLRDYEKPDQKSNKVCIRRVKETDKDSLYTLIRDKFSEEWARNIISGFHLNKPTVFIAELKNEIVGFGAYDVVRGKKGLFGPMGIIRNKRVHGIGYDILHYCLMDMKKTGYEYAVISEAGPIEFYEKACGAVVIHKN